MAIFTETCDVEITAGASVEIPEGNWKVVGASGWLTAAAGAAAAARVTRTRGGSTVNCCAAFIKGDGSALANLDPAKTAISWEGVEFGNLDIEAGDVISVAATDVESEVHVTLKRT